MDPNTYRAIMIGHTLAKLYVAIVEAKLSNYLKTLKLRAPEMLGLDEPPLLLIMSSPLDA